MLASFILAGKIGFNTCFENKKLRRRKVIIILSAGLSENRQQGKHAGGVLALFAMP
jgi:hypothetical protein